jgi:cyclopropane fatty-acyl-phospholipid synthase-like methyltransferase
VGAGAATYSIAIGSEYKDCTGVLLELPAMAPITQQFVARSGLEARFSVTPGDYRNGLPDGPFDDVFLYAVVHQEREDEVRRMLNWIHDVLRPGGRLFLSSFFLEESRIEPAFSVMFAIEMLVMVPNGNVYTHSEIQSLLQGASLESIERIDDLPGPATLYVSARP